VDPKILAAVVIGVVLVGGFVLFFPKPTVQPAVNDDVETDTNDADYSGGLPLPTLPRYDSISDCTSALPYTDQQDCRRQVAVLTKNPALCDALNGTDADWCKAEAFMASGQYSQCASLSGNAANQCRRNAAFSTEDDSYCKQIADDSGIDSLRDDCLRDLASVSGNLSTCAAMTNPDFKDDCIIRALLAQPAPNPDSCTLVVDSEGRDDCYYALAVALNTNALCGSINEPVYQEGCFNDLNADYVEPYDFEQ
jgi:hypothetical protein